MTRVGTSLGSALRDTGQGLPMLITVLLVVGLEATTYWIIRSTGGLPNAFPRVQPSDDPT